MCTLAWPGLGSSGGAGCREGLTGLCCAAAGQGGPSGLAGSLVLLHCSVDLRCSFLMPHPLAVAPGPLLSLTGGLLARFVLQVGGGVGGGR